MLDGIQKLGFDEGPSDFTHRENVNTDTPNQNWAGGTLLLSRHGALPALCDHCSSILPALQTALQNTYPQELPQKIGNYSPVHIQAFLDSDRSCALCKIALTVQSDYRESEFNRMRNHAFSLWAVNLLNEEERSRAIGYNDMNFATGIYVKKQDTTGRLGPEHDKKDMGNPYKPVRFNGLLMPLTKDYSPFAVHVIDPAKVDIDAVKSWMRECDEQHEKCQRSGSLKDMVGLKVIDCLEERIVKHDGVQPYIALSYVWGPPTSSTSDSLSGCPILISEAMEATKRLGYQYLWVDRYCIDQNNTEEKKIQIAQMDLVYENAELTIVSAAGDDRNGLSGIGSDRNPCLRKKQPMASLGSITLVSSMPDIHDYLEESRWATRGWTYQEALLSRRCLIFFPSQVFFVCQTMCRSETVPKFPALKEKDVRNLNLQTMFTPNDYMEDSTRYLGKPLDSRSENLRYHAKMFATRNLTYDADTLNAFMGILKRATVPSYYGIPILQLTMSATGASKNSNIGPTLLDPGQSQAESATAGFCMGLLWWTWDSEETNRRNGLPSWSWLSVRGNPIDFRYKDLGYLPTNANCRAKVWVDEKGSWTTLPDLVMSQNNNTRILPAIGKKLLIEAPSTTLSSIYGEFGSYYARLSQEGYSVVADLKLDCDSFVPEGFFGRYNNKWQGTIERGGLEHDASKLDWVCLQVLDMRGVIEKGMIECLLLRKTGSSFERIGILHCEKVIPGMLVERLIVE